MAKNRIAYCYFPTTIILIDDDKNYLDGLVLDLNEDLIFRTYSNPVEALKYLQQQYESKLQVAKCMTNLKEREIEELETDQLAHGAVGIDISVIRQKIYFPNRFEEISLIITDQAMPQMEGIELCNKLEDSPIKKILLTGVATPETAIDAFNKGIIHKFIKKEAYHFKEEVEAAIAELQLSYFQDLSEVVVKNLAINFDSALNDKLFIEFFNQFIKDNKVAEYYLVNQAGCFLLLDSNGEASFLVVKSENDMQEYTDAAIDNYAPQDIIDKLEQRTKVLFLLTSLEEQNVLVDDWKKYMYPATKLKGEKNSYYYSHVRDISRYDIRTNEIASYNNYLDRL